MKIGWHLISAVFMILSLIMGIISVIMNDADKAPIYFLFAVVFWRLN
ncbi:hypothetical protein JW835_15535 [bacterium]|nr:hypothetical protein [bacterium]